MSRRELEPARKDRAEPKDLRSRRVGRLVRICAYSALLVTAATAVSVLVRRHLSATDVVMLYLLAIMVAAFAFGTWPWGHPKVTSPSVGAPKAVIFSAVELTSSG